MPENKNLFPEITDLGYNACSMTAEEMEKRLKATYPQSTVAVIDSRGDQHHFEIRIKAPELETKTLIERHQEIMSVFDKELKSGEIHALSIKTL
ncbi:MAG: BolA/IbaG family iron-sulfur metabolism protein [Bdellovibrio sp.]|nr:MAG: BolA/IbaG family iron-sulfur metabolism protein [Bdellovibrio sp.]